MLCFEDLKPEARAEVERLMTAKGQSLDEAIEEIVTSAIAMGGLTFAGRPKAKVTQILGPPKEVGQSRDKKDTN
ncbi:hypothetical protein VPH49_25905 [Pseudomonas luteola]|uniref:hypothetical protein n=1 Tax=Pseudomonas luteola TaxID=47886 RepID=UPI003A86B23E